MKQKRHQTGVCGNAHDKLSLGAGLRKVEADYYAERAAAPRKSVMTAYQKQQVKTAAIRANSAMDAKTVSNIRHLRERCGWKCRQIAEKYGLTLARVKKICEYTTWAEISPSADGIDFL